jgi:hypothetical protein
VNGQENRHSKHWDQHQRIKVYQLVRAVGGQKLGNAGSAEEAGSDGDGEVVRLVSTDVVEICSVNTV